MQDTDGVTPLHDAAEQKCHEVIQLIIDSVSLCDLNLLLGIKSKSGRTAVDKESTFPWDTNTRLVCQKG